MLLTVSGDLQPLLKRKFRGKTTIFHDLERRASVKDVIESFGIPHTEVGGLRTNGREISFAHVVDNSEKIEIFSLPVPVDVLTPSLLRPQPLSGISFAVDDNVGKLASLLRMAGIDTYYSNDISDTELINIACQEGRIILSKDKELLKRKMVVFGHLVRASAPRKQLSEIIQLYRLQEQLRPFSRCLQCNDLLQPVDKLDILDRLEPLTIKYYDSFTTCRQCGNIYWPGSHRQRMMQILSGCLAGHS